jgi:hypothetical protein
MSRILLLSLLALQLLGCVRREQTTIEYVVTQPAPSVSTQAPAGGSVRVAPGTGAAQVVPPGAGAGYVLVGADDQSDAYAGDTPTSAMLPVLCLHPAGLPDPGLTEITRTPGGSLRRRWSGAEVSLTEPIVGSALTSRGVADDVCASRFGDGWRMAEFHDGGHRAGFDFWARAAQGDFAASRFWVAIDDQPACPWSGARAMTWRLLGSS